MPKDRKHGVGVHVRLEQNKVKLLKSVFKKFRYFRVSLDQLAQLQLDCMNV